MSTKLIPAFIRSWLEKKIYKTIDKHPVRLHRLPIYTLNYRPHPKTDESYIVPSAQTDSCEKCNLGLPIPPQELWLRYGPTQENYLQSGESNVKVIMDIAGQSGFALEAGNRILDFGCGAGRIIRHFKEWSSSCEIWGTEVNAECISWCSVHLSPPFHFATTTTVPYLPFEDGYFDLIYAASVFSHIGEMAQAWLLELKRVLSAKGRIFLTIQDRHSITQLEPEYIEKRLPEVIQATGENRDNQRTFSRAVNQKEAYRSAKDTDFAALVIGFKHDYYVFYDIDYFCQTMCSPFEVLSVTPEAMGFQTGVLLKRK